MDRPRPVLVQLARWALHGLMCLVVVVALLWMSGLLSITPADAQTGVAMQVMKRRILRYAAEHDAPPRSVEVLPPLEGYVDRVVDGWGRPIAMVVREDRVELRSLGRDGREGGTSDDRDLVGAFPLRGLDGGWAGELVPWISRPLSER